MESMAWEHWNIWEHRLHPSPFPGGMGAVGAGLFSELHPEFFLISFLMWSLISVLQVSPLAK